MNETKKTYIKPAIEGVYLLPDEAVLGGCKNVRQAGPNQVSDCVVGTGSCPSLSES